jgi:hypothetical protein
MPLIRLVHLTAVAGLLLCVTACATNRYRVTLASVRDYTQPTIGAPRDVYQSRNSYEIDLYPSRTSACRLTHLLKQAPIRRLIGPSIGNTKQVSRSRCRDQRDNED